MPLRVLLRGSVRREQGVAVELDAAFLRPGR